ncbi:hypothetical protein TIFTF001_052781 [Ficus carica]|uniref:MADS-box domain-containing protein n=1 Tax=Ficus carica TaxID=3494 RepID=A0AA88ECA3_FICCA|nr:hypothetical protein TIFTF001_052781 [Ficus carica]
MLQQSLQQAVAEADKKCQAGIIATRRIQLIFCGGHFSTSVGRTVFTAAFPTAFGRISTIKKKAGELTALCKVEVCIVCFAPNGDLEVWPENPTKAESIIAKYREASKKGNKRKRKVKLDLSDLLENKIKTLKKQVSDDESVWDDSNNEIGGLTFWDEALDSLLDLSDCLEAKIQNLSQMIESLKGKQLVPSIAQNEFDHKYMPFDTPLHENLPFAGYHNSIC